MKREKVLLGLFLGIVGILWLQSCKKIQCKEDKTSVSGESESHNFGQNCMNCHVSGGEGEGCFVVAGSVENPTGNPSSSGQIEFYTQPNGGGTLKYTVPIDAKGNFYTTNTNTYTGLYPAVKGATQTKYMSSAITTGACNTCHGGSQPRIVAE